MGPQIQIFLGVAEEGDNLLQLLLFLVSAGYVLEGDPLLPLGDGIDPGLAEAGHLVVHAAHAAAHGPQQIDDEEEAQQTQHVGGQGLEIVGGMVGVVVIVGDDAGGLLLLHQVIEIVIKGGEIVQVADHLAAVGELGGKAGVTDGELLHLLVQKILAQRGVADALTGAHGADEIQRGAHHGHQQQYGAEADVFTVIVYQKVPPTARFLRNARENRLAQWARRMPCQLWLPPMLMVTSTLEFSLAKGI